MLFFPSLATFVLVFWRSLLDNWQVPRLRAVFRLDDDKDFRDGTKGLNCSKVFFCEAAVSTLCATICRPGTVYMEPWLKHAIRTQTLIAQEVSSLCHAQTLGTHNSAITLADGYGLRDEYYTGLLNRTARSLLQGRTRINTANQLVSITDQLNMGVRFIELDVHQVEGGLRIAHCGHKHVRDRISQGLLGAVQSLYSTVTGEKLLWNYDQLGCSPSLSSIPTNEQRFLDDSLAEIYNWTQRAENLDQVLILFIDSDPSLLRWHLMTDLHAALVKGLGGLAHIYKPSDREQEFMAPLHKLQSWQWPSLRSLRDRGFRFLLITNVLEGIPTSPVDHSGPFEDTAVQRSDLDLLHRHAGSSFCGFSDVNIASLESPFPECTRYNSHWPLPSSTRLRRVRSCSLQYGPLDCSGVEGETDVEAQNRNLSGFVRCGIGLPSPDFLTPQLVAEELVWTWAPGEPAPLFSPDASPQSASASCTAVRRDGRWIAVPCAGEQTKLRACVEMGSLSKRVGTWRLFATNQSIPEGVTCGAVPRHAFESALIGSLIDQAQEPAIEYALLDAIRGPAFKLPYDTYSSGGRIMD